MNNDNVINLQGWKKFNYSAENAALNLFSLHGLCNSPVLNLWIVAPLENLWLQKYLQIDL